jgi:hypothetical protein
MARNDFSLRREAGSRWSRVPFLPHDGHPARAALIGTGLAVYAWIDATAAPFSVRSLIGVLIPGAAIGAIAYTRPPRRVQPPEELDMLGMSYWLICLAALFEWEASAYRDNSPFWHPSLTSLVNPLLGPHMVKSAAIMVWVLVGWGLVKR